MEQVMEAMLGEAKTLPDKFRIAGDSLGERCRKLKQRQKEPWGKVREAVRSAGVNLICGLQRGLTEIVYMLHFREKKKS